jgi:hypothetical protein
MVDVAAEASGEVRVCTFIPLIRIGQSAQVLQPF